MVTGIGTRSALAVQSLVDMRRQLDDLQRQLGTGKRSTTYAGLGLDRGLTVGLRAQISAMTGYGKSMQTIGLRLDFAMPALTRIGEIAQEVKIQAQQPAAIKPSGRTLAQESALLQLDEMLEMLNTRASDRYIFGGRAVDAPPVATLDHVLDGDGARAGLKQLIQERTAADRGADGLGRLVIPAAAGTVVSVSEDVAGSPFGLKLVSASTTLTGAVVAGPAGAPPAVTVTLGAMNPNAGEVVRVTLALPDGTEETVTLTASTSATAPGEFSIGADSNATAANLQAALHAAVLEIGDTELAAASALAASDNFFNIDVGVPPQRVDGPPFDTAVALIAGTPANTVTWYTGEMGTDPARGSAIGRIDDSMTVRYGMRANEQALRWAVQHVAAFAAVTFPSSGASDAAEYAALAERVTRGLAYPAGVQRIEDIAAELANVQVTMQNTKERHVQMNHTLGGLLDSVEGVPTEQVAAEILALQTRLQASLQTTSMMYQISLVNYL